MDDRLPSQTPNVLKLLAHDVRWQLLSVLRRSDCRVQELVAASAKPQNLVSYHLRQLRDAGLVHERRGDADSRDVYYHLDVSRLRMLLSEAAHLLHPALFREAGSGPQPIGPRRVIFLCTHNSARSQMAEAILAARGPSSLQVFSAGSEPAEVHPLAIQVLAEMGIDMRGQVSKHFNRFIGERFDCVVTVCDRIREICPVFEGGPEPIHWSIPDPAEASGSAAERYAVFQQTAAELAMRIDNLLPDLVGLTDWGVT